MCQRPISAAFALLLGMLVASACALAQSRNTDPMHAQARLTEQLQHEALLLDRDLTTLERELNYPGQTRISVFLAVDVSQPFDLQEVEITLDQTVAARVKYQPSQGTALLHGGVDRVYLGNLPRGGHRFHARFTGKSGKGRSIGGEATMNVLKTRRPTLLLLQIVDSEDSAEPALRIAEWAQ